MANEPVGLNQVTPVPMVVHQLPEFDQDSWTINPPTEPEKITRGSPGNTPDQRNNNNNNNTFITEGQQSLGHGSAANQASILNSDSHPVDPVSALNRAAAAATNGGNSLTVVASPPSELDGNRSQTAEEVACDGMTSDGMAVEPQPVSETRQQPAIDGEDVQESSADGQDAVQ